MRAYVLVELGDSEAIDLFLREEDAQAALEDALHDEPAWAGTLRLTGIRAFDRVWDVRIEDSRVSVEERE